MAKPQTEYNKKYQAKDKERTAYLKYRSFSRSFIKNKSELEDLIELKELIRLREIELNNKSLEKEKINTEVEFTELKKTIDKLKSNSDNNSFDDDDLFDEKVDYNLNF